MEQIDNFGNNLEQQEPQRPLHICGAGCGCELVAPMKIDPETPFCQFLGENQWQMILLCPDCNHVEEGVYTTAQVDAYDAHMDKAKAAVESQADALMHNGMEQYVEQSISALFEDHVLPEDA